MESWSGIGLVKNYGDPLPSETPFPAYWNRTIAVEPKPIYNFTQFIPQAVVINLGTNDYSEEPFPSRAQFESAYITFIETIRESYGSPIPVFLVCGPMSPSAQSCPYIQNVVKQVKNSYYIPMNGLLNDKNYGVGPLPPHEWSLTSSSAMDTPTYLVMRRWRKLSFLSSQRHWDGTKYKLYSAKSCPSTGGGAKSQNQTKTFQFTSLPGLGLRELAAREGSKWEPERI